MFLNEEALAPLRVVAPRKKRKDCEMEGAISITDFTLLKFNAVTEVKEKNC